MSREPQRSCVDLISRPATRRANGTREIVFRVLSRIGNRGKFRMVKTVRVMMKGTATSHFTKALEIEKELNNGLFSHEAEAVYARAGLHGKEVFKIHLLARSDETKKLYQV